MRTQKATTAKSTKKATKGAKAPKQAGAKTPKLNQRSPVRQQEGDRAETATPRWRRKPGRHREATIGRITAFAGSSVGRLARRWAETRIDKVRWRRSQLSDPVID
jgi:hypothetical protein